MGLARAQTDAGDADPDAATGIASVAGDLGVQVQCIDAMPVVAGQLSAGTNQTISNSSPSGSLPYKDFVVP